jgi:hypothetical protein
MVKRGEIYRMYPGYLCVAFVVWVVMSVSMFNQALACACCADPGVRLVAVEKVTSARREAIGQLRFGRTAELFVSEAGIESIKGIVNPSEHYNLEVTRERDRLVFAFRVRQGAQAH